MAPDVSKAIRGVFMQHGRMTATAAAAKLAQLEASGQLQKDVY